MMLRLKTLLVFATFTYVSIIFTDCNTPSVLTLKYVSYKNILAVFLNTCYLILNYNHESLLSRQTVPLLKTDYISVLSEKS
jgi:hypothetical protein